jgi:hypothetical protein
LQAVAELGRRTIRHQTLRLIGEHDRPHAGGGSFQSFSNAGIACLASLQAKER